MTTARTIYANRWVRYFLTTLLLAIVLLKVNPGHVARSVASVRADDLALALALTLPFLYLKALRWYLMMRAASVDVTFAEAATSLVGGMGLALVTPARLGELIRVAYLRDPQKLKIGGLVLLDKGFDVLVLAAFSVPGAWTLLGPPAGVVMAGVTVAGLALVFGAHRMKSVSRTLSTGGALGARVSRIWSGLNGLGPANVAVFLGLTGLAFLLVFLQFGLILLSWRGWSMDVVFLTFPLVILTNVIPITIGGLGVREGAAAALLSHYGVSPSDAALTAFLSFAMNTFLPGLIGAFLLPAAPRARPAVPLQDHP